MCEAAPGQKICKTRFALGFKCVIPAPGFHVLLTEFWAMLDSEPSKWLNPTPIKPVVTLPRNRRLEYASSSSRIA
tara:strand:+ start:1786 stop:2010 length:225 start_codon:yes stop_codon:yes gene_type:complete